MKKQILDIPFRDSFNDFLEKEEKILWEGSTEKSGYDISTTEPKKEKYTLKNFATSFLLGVLWIGLYSFLETAGLWISAFIFIIIFIIFRVRKNAFVEYAITTKRIFFKSNNFKKAKIFQIPFSEINNCVVVENENNRGVIFLALKNPESIPFDTYSMANNESEKRHQPTLENIKTPQAVAKLIREGIRNNP